MTKSTGIGRGGAREGAGRKRVQLTDLQKFVALYKSFGIECIVNKEHELSNAYISFATPNPNQDNGIDTISDLFLADKIESQNMGELFAYSQIWFDATGKFINQEFLIP